MLEYIDDARSHERKKITLRTSENSQLPPDRPIGEWRRGK